MYLWLKLLRERYKIFAVDAHERQISKTRTRRRALLAASDQSRVILWAVLSRTCVAVSFHSNAQHVYVCWSLLYDMSSKDTVRNSVPSVLAAVMSLTYLEQGNRVHPLHRQWKCSSRDLFRLRCWTFPKKLTSSICLCDRLPTVTYSTVNRYNLWNSSWKQLHVEQFSQIIVDTQNL